ncbi:hypothetical protein [Halpernia frigidisoli]|uniref:Uncharacterized protein n=1 Tax=Halpernia frigidisoli TaxID=1125876 RepID=A0A1I3CTQ2_9FLAO|nr:hypothetical protein [Halpernia frigidisoli]SFH77803.1 hypothetical protein SAMN05443292_0070 [Halpernia frigidisoli]
MINYNGDLAIDLDTVKAIKMVFLPQGGNLIFEFNNMIVPIKNEDTGEMELKSFRNDAISHYIDMRDSLRAYFDEWVEFWQESKK